MTLTTHAVVGAAAASFFPDNPAGALAAFCVGFGAHFLLDAIPHWDYPIRSSFVDPQVGAKMHFDNSLRSDILTIGSDCLLGIALGLLLFAFLFKAADSLNNPWLFWVILAGALGGIVPDALQFIYGHWKHEPLLSLQRFHEWCHTDMRFRGKSFIGIASQIALLAILVVGAVVLKYHV